VAVAEVGAPPTLVLLPGLDGTGTLFAPFLAAWGPDLPTQVIRYPTEGPQDVATLAAYVAARLPTGPHVLLGESFSGPIALTLAATNPTGLRGLILCATFVSNPRPGLAWARGLIPHLPMGPGVMPLLAPLTLGCRGRELAQSLRVALGSTPPSILRARLTQVVTLDASAACARVTVPILDLRASWDRLVPEAAARKVARLLPALDSITFPAPHLLLQTRPQETAAAVATFLRRLG
jgi:pimeloyl-[acyl-carrier protein] methyl ester esterase